MKVYVKTTKLRPLDEQDILRIFVQEAPYFTEDDWQSLPPEWRILWNAVRRLTLNLRGLGPVAAIEILWEIILLVGQHEQV